MDNIFQKGIPLTVAWRLVKPDGTDFNLVGYTHRLYYGVGNRFTAVSSTTVAGNVVTWVFPAESQTAAGDYSLRLMIFQNGKIFTTVAYDKAFSLYIGTSANSQQTAGANVGNVVSLLTVAEFYALAPVVPTVGDDGFWWVNGERLVNAAGENVAADHTVEYDGESHYIIIDRGRVNAQGESIEQTITDLATALSDAAQATSLANEKAALANEKANLAAAKAGLADEKANLADEKAGLANEKANLAATKAGLANEKAADAESAASRANAAAAAAEHMVDIKRGPQGPQGNTGASVDYPYELVNNLTTDDATKGLSAAQGVVLKEGISQLGQQVLDNYFVGNNNTAVSADVVGLKPGNTYLIIPAQNTFDITGVTVSGGNNVFLVQFINQDDTATSSQVAVTKDMMSQDGLADSYQVTIPSDKKGILRFYGRATEGEEVRFCIYDVTYLNKNLDDIDAEFISALRSQTFTDTQKAQALANLGFSDILPVENPLTGNVHPITSGGVSKVLFNNVIIGNGNTLSSVDITGLRPGNKYILIPRSATWDLPSISGSYAFALQYEQSDGTFAVMSDTDLSLQRFNGGKIGYVVFTFPADAKELLRVSVRAVAGTEIRFSIYDITYQDGLNNKFTPLPLDIYGTDSFSFQLLGASHSQLLDQYFINAKSGDVISGTVSLGNNAQLDSTTRRFKAYLFYKDGTSAATEYVSLDANNTASFSIIAAKDVQSIGFYIATIITSGTWNVVIQKQGSILSRIAALESAEESGAVPTYFVEQLSQVIEDANKDIANVGADGDNFIFITDIHWESNAKKSPALIHNICDRMYLDNVIFGGDAINGIVDQNAAREYIAAVASGLRNARSHFAAAFGNHDDNSNNGTAFANHDQPFYALMQKPNDYRVTEKVVNCYYYFDNPACNTRFIVLNSSTTYNISSTQQTWLRGILTNTPAGMHIIIFVHIYIREVRQTSEDVYIGYDFEISNSGSTINTILADFTDKKIEAVFAGHAHLDANGMTDSMVPVVVSDCDGRNTFMWPNTLNTINEQSFDVVTIAYTDKVITCRRVGRGKSRIIHYSTNTLNVGETLDISSLVSIVPTSYSIRDNFSLQYRNEAGGGTGVTFNGTHASVTNAGVVSAVSEGYVVAVAENDDTIETFNIKIS